MNGGDYASQLFLHLGSESIYSKRLNVPSNMTTLNFGYVLRR
jgi:hypothetical protein